jgi:hypothetical protein
MISVNRDLFIVVKGKCKSGRTCSKSLISSDGDDIFMMHGDLDAICGDAISELALDSTP